MGTVTGVMVTGMVGMPIMMGMIGTTIMVMAITTMIGLTGGATETTMIGMIVGPGGLTVGGMVLVGIRVTERTTPPSMVITLIPTSATPQGTAGIHVPTIIMGISSRAAWKFTRCPNGPTVPASPPIFEALQ